jgi:hypothetical protein
MSTKCNTPYLCVPAMYEEVPVIQMLILLGSNSIANCQLHYVVQQALTNKRSSETWLGQFSQCLTLLRVSHSLIVPS